MKKNSPGCNCCGVTVCTECCTDSSPTTIEVSIPSGEFTNNGCSDCTALNGTTIVLTSCSGLFTNSCNQACPTQSSPVFACVWRYQNAARCLPVSEVLPPIGCRAILITSGGQCKLQIEFGFMCGGGFIVQHTYYESALEAAGACAGKVWTCNYNSSVDCSSEGCCTVAGTSLTATAV